ncbi:GntR family transcriptional regulator [bacterium (Candidatus Blackallbacteria) CG17_big_fil_post_rev_8_21_14_2_50_48_46]|uniref:GntR family transcriptional regulator n=1 Tax=bacterium (Candidatus Blackallbacteria) CG17_big_fil_post_rev_8_21_14_2_50_48_46 TaxID=2014261 RepID=A0A2M7G190_9BACT|nr:MAG: GntR family transcriptional regulator [bacterium (Candidatus Blackallbacteria) CG18_big_fil_WC_8_21_14_2_50_49_26]PIW15479.1 MAG: GntR family transcriptional regulator [bacterium (Candidatus Blackallbacteria) CG17_big_fil_post_rev_8_21_14_2_50_48_46]PIW48621.1 MAG: GntR family transcriptional regulator [bacterium (Candidatus Blackallbacteria) CG13_big_fil_rev_8_21_14_2_50_49_14]
MVAIGRFNQLEIIKERSVGYFFDGGEDGDILMPKRHQPEHCEVGDFLNVFIFHDAEGRLTATTRIPSAQVGEVAWLKVVEVHRIGAFLDWNMTKDLLVPIREQVELMVPHQSYLVYIHLDEDQRIIGSSRLEKFIQDENQGQFSYGQEVDLLIAEETDLGFKAVVDNSHWGLIYSNEIFQPLHIGQKAKGYIKKLRDDGKIDVALEKPGYSPDRIEELARRIYQRIQLFDGFLPLTDKSPPEVIQDEFQVSKKNFKQAVGKLYKERRILIEEKGLRAVK